MLNKIKFFALIGFALAIVLNSCDTNSTNPTDNEKQPKPQPISNLQATSIDTNTIKLMYDLSPSETNALFQDYQLVVTPGTNPPVVITKGNNLVQLTNLDEGTIYTISIVARYTNDSVSTPVSIEWSPATRFELNNNDALIRVYESASDLGNGLRLFSPAPDNAPRTYTVANGANWDLGLYTKDSKLVFGSATKIDYKYPTMPAPTQMLDEVFNTNSLNELFDSNAMNAGARDSKYAETTFDLTSPTYTNNLVFYVRKYEPGNTRYNYAKVLVKKNPNGAGYLQGSSPNRYIEMQISYQKTPDVPFAKVGSNNNSK